MPLNRGTIRPNHKMAWTLLPKLSFQYFEISLLLTKEKEPMLWTIVVILLILWLLGFTMFHVGSLIHLLLVIALIVIVINLVSGRRAV
jgi:hypothetical protein